MKVNVAMSMFGHMEPFVIGENFDEYVSRLQQFFIVIDVEETKKVPMLVTMAGPSLYSIANRICSPEDPCSKPCKNQIELLKQHLAPKVNVMAERCKYHKCEQAANQTITEFIIELKALSQSCDFGTFLSQALRDRFVAGLQNSGLRTKLLAEGDLTLEKACEIGRSCRMLEVGRCKDQQNWQRSFKQRTSWKSSDRTPQGIEIINAFVVAEIITKEIIPCPAKQWKCYACGNIGLVGRQECSKRYQGKLFVR
uniref:CCHC-type domain-containing protein n=1 Tax=Anopheles stephensi TaxID=30069 RepID=A0A182YR20_ANOST